MYVQTQGFNIQDMQALFEWETSTTTAPRSGQSPITCELSPQFQLQPYTPHTSAYHAPGHRLALHLETGASVLAQYAHLPHRNLPRIQEHGLRGPRRLRRHDHFGLCGHLGAVQQ